MKKILFLSLFFAISCAGIAQGAAAAVAKQAQAVALKPEAAAKVLRGVHHNTLAALTDRQINLINEAITNMQIASEVKKTMSAREFAQRPEFQRAGVRDAYNSLLTYIQELMSAAGFERYTLLQ
jgi:hypothetical protein